MILLKSLEFCIRFAPDVSFPPWSRNWAPVGAKRAARDPRAEEVWMHSLCWSNIALSLSPATGWMLGWYRWYLVMAAVTCWVSHRISWSTWVQDLMYGSITCLNLEDSDRWWDDITVYYSNINWSSGKPANIKYGRIYYAIQYMVVWGVCCKLLPQSNSGRHGSKLSNFKRPRGPEENSWCSLFSVVNINSTQFWSLAPTLVTRMVWQWMATVQEGRFIGGV